jgi:hypothetical protein
MPVDILKHSRGITDSLFEAMILDDMPHSITREQNILESCGVASNLQTRPGPFVMMLQEWCYKREQYDAATRAEMRCLLVIDVFIQNFPDLTPLREILEVNDQTANALGASTSDGRWAGLVLIHELRKLFLPYFEWPAIIVSAYGIHGAEDRLRDLERTERSRPPVRYLEKAVLGARPDEKFRNLSLELLHDSRLYFVHRLANLWDLDEGQVCGLFSMQTLDPRLLGVIFDRGRPPPTRDSDERVRALRRIHQTLHSLLRDRDAQMEWLHARLPDLDNQKPIDLLLSGRMENMIAVKAYLDFLRQ